MGDPSVGGVIPSREKDKKKAIDRYPINRFLVAKKLKKLKDGL